MYKLLKNSTTNNVCAISIQINNVLNSIPFDPANTDYQTFRKEVLAGAELQDANGNVMTDAKDYVRTLP